MHPGVPRPAKIRTTVSIDRDLFDWLNEQVGVGLRFHNFSHAHETAIVALKREGECEEELLHLRARLRALEDATGSTSRM